jgi:hypothetical protein
MSMQDRYAGDVGDFGKFAVLRALARNRHVGVCWYRCSGEGEHNNDGRHVAYLSCPERYRELDHEVFDAMARVVRSERSLRALEACALLPGATYHGEEVPRRAEDRRSWFAAMSRTMESCDFVFIDADNGFEWSVLSPKCVARDEVRALRRPGRALLLYHHQTRRAGGAAAEFERFVAWLFDVGAQSAEAVRLRPYSSRFYLLVDGDAALSGALCAFRDRWKEKVEHFPRRDR